MNWMKWLRPFGWLGLLSLLAAGPRARVDLSAGWRFACGDAADAQTPSFDDSAWEPVALPHTWNRLDGQDGGNNYKRGPGWYRLHLRPQSDWTGRRIYLRVGAASQQAAVYLNGTLVGTHQGGFTAFCFDLTPLLHLAGDNVLALRVDNGRDQNVPPLTGDFTVFGGLYRGAELILTDPLCVSPLDDASSGVYVRQDAVDAEAARLTITTVVRNAGATDRTAAVHCEMAGASADQTQLVPAGQSVDVEQHLTVPHPHLWDGRADPFEMPVQVTLSDGDRVIDAVEQQVGLRSFHVDPDRGFFLNGHPYRLVGVNRHQDHLEAGWAVSPADEQLDATNLLDMGCTVVRTSHYPQSPTFYDLMDRTGVVVWTEIPLVNQITASATFGDNAEQQLREMIHQNFNHPSICFWGLFNELSNGKSEPAELNLLHRLNDVAHQLDPTRLTTAASSQSVRDKLAMLPDLASYNRYPGWYSQQLSDWPKTLAEFHRLHPDRCVAVSEYGAGASVVQHESEPIHRPIPASGWHPEEYQADYHEQAWAAMKDQHWLWASIVWCLHDCASDGRREGDHAGRNDKGLVTFDGKTRKDAFYFYQANWATPPMVYITDRRFTPRPPSARGLKVYSNCDRVVLTLNGQALPPATPNDVHVFTWPDVAMPAGSNQLLATGTQDGKTVTDRCTIITDPSMLATTGPATTRP